MNKKVKPKTKLETTKLMEVNNMEEWYNKLKVGDKVIVEYSHWGSHSLAISKVENVTPTGQIKVVGHESRFKFDGVFKRPVIMGRNSFDALITLEEWTECKEKTIFDNTRRRAISKKLNEMTFSKLSLDQLERIVEIIEE